MGGVEHQDIGGHQHRIGKQPHGDAVVRVVVALGDVGVHRRFVGVGAVHQALGADTVEDPGEFGDFRDIGLAVEGDAFRIKTAGEPGSGNGEGGAVDLLRVVAFDDAVVIGEEEEGFFAAAGLTCGDGGADGADVVAEVRDAGSGDAGENTGVAHAKFLNDLKNGAGLYRRTAKIRRLCRHLARFSL
ncbi:hypothetical protein HMPREF9080_01230 [Cardiobacterium valvarum F0432]|uniref:Uncharacterized protein n=1 Tax=Cardiobacterium valvarum F0432 TaxID=797473 RepID=G9ZEP9_9GAMM|nr:hypothetical protein HMPREF9080_01230 [Cardiobacterium valvarum F0432]